MYSRDELSAAHDHFMGVSRSAQENGDWEDYCDLFTEDAIYVEHFLGISHGREEIKKWFIPAMSAWPQMRYPLLWRTLDEERGLVVFGVGGRGGMRGWFGFGRATILARRRRGSRGGQLRAASIAIVKSVYIFVAALAALDHLLSTSLAGITALPS